MNPYEHKDDGWGLTYGYPIGRRLGRHFERPEAGLPGPTGRPKRDRSKRKAEKAARKRNRR